jgi:hypothetical protein
LQENNKIISLPYGKVSGGAIAMDYVSKFSFINYFFCRKIKLQDQKKLREGLYGSQKNVSHCCRKVMQELHFLESLGFNVSLQYI